MKLLMCVACGEFVSAVQDGGDLLPTEDTCPSCGGTTFEDNESGEVVHTDG